MYIHGKPSRQEIEFSTLWIKQNPELFYQSYGKFFADHANGWRISSKVGEHRITLIAEII
jgi:hypothetical protein